MCRLINKAISDLYFINLGQGVKPGSSLFGRPGINPPDHTEVTACYAYSTSV